MYLVHTSLPYLDSLPLLKVGSRPPASEKMQVKPLRSV